MKAVMVTGTWHLVPGTLYLVPGNKYQVLGTWDQVLDTWYLDVPGTWYQIHQTSQDRQPNCNAVRVHYLKTGEAAVHLQTEQCHTIVSTSFLGHRGEVVPVREFEEKIVVLDVILGRFGDAVFRDGCTAWA